MKALGVVQKRCIAMLQEHGKTWYNGCGWIWDTPSRTERIMDSLARRGIVRVELDAYKIKHYHLEKSHGADRS